MAVTRIVDVVVPEEFTEYTRQRTERKSRIIQSGIAVRDAFIDGLMSGGGLTFNVPAWTPIDRSTHENVSTDDPDDKSTPKKIGKAQEIAVRLNRNESWSTMDLARQLAGSDPMMAIGEEVSDFWSYRQQVAFVATVTGVLADNANDADDYTYDISGAGFVDGVTNFSAEACIYASATLGDSANKLTAIIMHSVVYHRMRVNNLIDFIPDSETNRNIPYFMELEVIVDDGMPTSGGVYDTWLFGPGFARLGVADPPVPTEVWRDPSSGTGSGQDVLHSRVQWIIHPNLHAWIGDLSGSPGGPANTGTAGVDLDEAAGWNRVAAERKMVPFARLRTREAAA